MAVTIQDDMLEAAGQMSKKDGDAFLLALLAYGYTGAEPKGKPTWLPTFTTCKKRITLSEKSRKKAKAMAESRWGKDDAQASCTSMMHEHDAAADAQASCTSTMQQDDAQAGCLDEVRLGEVRRGEASAPARAQEWCMDEWQDGFRVLDSSHEGHQRPSESLAATYAAVHGSDSGFSRVRKAMERGRCATCQRGEDDVIACHNVTRDALERWDRPLDGDPSRIIRKMLKEDVDG